MGAFVSANQNEGASTDVNAVRGVVAYLAVSGIVFVFTLLLGLLSYAGETGYLLLPKPFIAQVTSAQGVGMVLAALLGGSAVMWTFLRQQVALSTPILLLNLLLYVVGLGMVFGAIFMGGPDAIELQLIGLLSVDIGFLMFFLDAGRGIRRDCGGLRAALGWRHLLFGEDEFGPSPTLVASATAVIVSAIALTVGGAILVSSLTHFFEPALTVEGLLATNQMFFFGHVFVSVALYMALVAVFEILPSYADRTWCSSRVFLGAWALSMVLSLSAYPLYLLPDFDGPIWLRWVGQIISYGDVVPVLAVCAYGATALFWLCGIRWNAASGLLFLALWGCATGIVPGIADATLVLLHATNETPTTPVPWVPGHFQFYVSLGLLPMVLGLMSHATTADGQADSGLARAGFWAYVIGGLGFTAMFLFVREQGVYADQTALAFAMLAIMGVVIYASRFLWDIPRLVAQN
jgi:cytochrome c oxidase subunit I